MADYILRADNPSSLSSASKVYLTENGSWTDIKMKAKIFTAKTRATDAKKSATIPCEIIQPDFDTNSAVEDEV
jgi:hypothetical protein